MEKQTGLKKVERKEYLTASETLSEIVAFAVMKLPILRKIKYLRAAVYHTGRVATEITKNLTGIGKFQKCNSFSATTAFQSRLKAKITPAISSAKLYESGCWAVKKTELESIACERDENDSLDAEYTERQNHK